MSDKKSKGEKRKQLVIRVICVVMCAALIVTLIAATSCS